MSTIRRLAWMGLACALLAGCARKDEAAADAATPALAVTVAPAQMQEVERAIAVSGPVTAREEMQLGVEVSGLRVTGLYVDVGEFVQLGQPLLELDSRMLDAELKQARAAHSEAQAAATLAQSNLRRAEALARDRFISASQVDELRAARTQASARVATARAALDAAAAA